MDDIVLLGGSFNPPTRAHRLCAKLLSGVFGRVAAVVCGIRPDKAATNAVAAVHRARMSQIAFNGIPKVDVDLTDLERAEFMTTFELDRLWKARNPGAEIWHAVGSDLIVGGRDGASEIQRKWHQGRTVWNTLRFAVIPRPGYAFTEADLPPNARVMPFPMPDDSSTKARDLLSAGQDIGEIVSDKVAAYAQRFGLYGFVPGSRMEGRLRLPAKPKVFVVADPGNPKAMSRARRLRWRCHHVEDADLIIAIGGDGHMLHVIRQYGTACVPILGLNAGHLGFLLNELSPEALNRQISAQAAFTTHLLPMLAVRIQALDGTWGEELLAFQDAWLERTTPQTAWFTVTVQGRRTRVIEKLSCDAVLGCNPAGSGAYARSMGASPLLLHTPLLTLAASAVSRPDRWRPMQLADTSTMTFEGRNVDKRPIRAVVDGVDHGPALGMRIRQSRAAGVELAFAPDHSLADKIEAISFPVG